MFLPELLIINAVSNWRSHVVLSSPTIETERLILRMAREQDAIAILKYYLENRDFLNAYEPTRCEEFYTLEFWREQVEKALIEFSYEHSLKLCLFNKNDSRKLIGKVNFYQIQRGVSYSCMVGYSLAEHEQSKGYMTEALTAAIDYIFLERNLHRVMANYMPHNQRSSNVLKRLGFTVEGYARDYLLINGKWEDHILTSLINPRWKS